MAQLIVLEAVVNQNYEKVKMSMKGYETGFKRTFQKMFLTITISRSNTPYIVKFVLNMKPVKREVIMNSSER